MADDGAMDGAIIDRGDAITRAALLAPLLDRRYFDPIDNGNNVGIIGPPPVPVHATPAMRNTVIQLVEQQNEQNVDWLGVQYGYRYSRAIQGTGNNRRRWYVARVLMRQLGEAVNGLAACALTDDYLPAVEMSLHQFARYQNVIASLQLQNKVSDVLIAGTTVLVVFTMRVFDVNNKEDNYTPSKQLQTMFDSSNSLQDCSKGGQTIPQHDAHSKLSSESSNCAIGQAVCYLDNRLFGNNDDEKTKK